MALCIEDLKTLRQSLHSVHRKWYDIGLELNLHPDSLDNIASNCGSDASRALLEMLKKWLRQVDPAPTWESVVKALEQCTVGEEHLAVQLREKFCSQEPQRGRAECRPVVSPVSRMEVRLHDLQEELKKRTDELIRLKCKRSLDDRNDITEVPTTGDDNIGIDYVAKRHIEISSGSAHNFELKGLGFKMCIPEGALPPGQSDAKLTIKVSLSGQYATGHSHELASAVYWVDSPVDFQKPVTIEMQHSAMFKDPDQPPPKFAVIPNSPDELPLSFSMVEGGVFSTCSQYGTIDVKKFSGWAIVVPRGTPQLYCSQLWYSQCPTLQPLIYTNSPMSVLKVFFSITRFLDAMTYAMGLSLDDVVPGPAIPVEFEGSEISMDISPEGSKRGETEIIPRHPPVITKDEVDSFGRGQFCPVCELTVRKKLLADYEQCVVGLIGAKAPHSYIILDLERAVMDTTKFDAFVHFEELGNFVRQINFTVGKDISMNDVSGVIQTRMQLRFEEDTITIDISDEGDFINGWLITPLNHPVISRLYVASVGEMMCSFALQWMGQTYPPTLLQHRVKLLGARAPGDYFTVLSTSGYSMPNPVPYRTSSYTQGVYPHPQPRYQQYTNPGPPFTDYIGPGVRDGYAGGHGVVEFPDRPPVLLYGPISNSTTSSVPEQMGSLDTSSSLGKLTADIDDDRDSGGEV